MHKVNRPLMSALYPANLLDLAASRVVLLWVFSVSLNFISQWLRFSSLFLTATLLLVPLTAKSVRCLVKEMGGIDHLFIDH